MISVCLAAYNGEKYIQEQIDSILIQLGDSDEIIISDDNSSDNTMAIIKNYNDHRIKIIKNNGIHGYSHNFENALKHTSGDYIFWSDQDDVWLPNKVETILPFLIKDNLVVTDAYITNENLEIQKRLSQYRKYRNGYLRNLTKNIYMGCTNAFTKNIKDYCLPFPCSIYVPHDVWIGLLCELKFNVVYIDEPLILYRRHQNNLSEAGSKSNKTIWYMLRYRLILLYETLKRINNG
jgi:glycosyltransferase involved in cell wall biosynthesis